MLAALSLIIALNIAAPPKELASFWPDCPEASITATNMSCDTTSCTFSDGVQINCHNGLLTASELKLNFDENMAITASEITGPVTTIVGTAVATCQSASIDGKGQITSLKGAKIKVKEETSQEVLLALPEEAHKAGKNKVELGGTVSQDPDGYTIDEAYFTLCDCGEQKPSWWLTAKKARFVLEERARLYSAVVHITPFSLFTMPILWIPYISYPLKDRGIGFLAPRIQSMFSTWPAIDLPFFIPIGESYDITLIPGYFPTRGPRGGLEFRYAPAAGTYGEFSAQYTGHIHSPQNLFATDSKGRVNSDRLDPRREGLIHRWEAHWHHRSEFAREVSLLTDINVLGDRLYYYDFSPTYRSARYVPSRLQLLWQSKINLSWQISGDFYQDLHPAWNGHDEFTAARCREEWHEECSVYYNWQNISQMVQRLPATRLVLSPTSLGGLPLWIAAEANSTIYAPWNNYGSQLFGVLNGRAEIGGTLQRFKVPLAMDASYNYTHTFSGHKGSSYLHFPRLALWSDTRLGRLFNSRHEGRHFTHKMNFRVDYLLIPVVYQNETATVLWEAASGIPLAATISDEHLQLKPVQQIRLTSGTAFKFHPSGLILKLKLSQGFNLGGLKEAVAPGPGQFGVNLALSLPRWFETHMRVSLDWKDQPHMKEVNVGGRFYFWRQSYVEAGYYHLDGGNDQLLASIYELIPGGGFPTMLANGEDHYLNTAINFEIKGWTLRYGLRYIFNLNSLTEEENRNRYRGDIDRHYLKIGYQSPCDCWGVSLALIMPHQYLKGNTSSQFAPSFNITLDLAGLALGMRNN